MDDSHDFACILKLLKFLNVSSDWKNDYLAINIDHFKYTFTKTSVVSIILCHILHHFFNRGTDGKTRIVYIKIKTVLTVQFYTKVMVGQ